MKQLQETIDQLQKDLKARDEFFAVISHEIRNYIHGVYLISDYLGTDYDKINDGDRKTHISTILQNIEGLRNLVEDLLDLSKFNLRQVELDFDDMDFLVVLHKVINHYNKVILYNNESSQIIFEHCDFPEALIFGDYQRIQQVLMNLFINAIKYSCQGSIIVKLDMTNIDDISYWECSISDQGIGIPVDNIEYVFDPFFRSAEAKKLTSGSGVGLAVCKKIIEGHNGKISVKNNNDKGTTFTILLPVLAS